MSAGGHHEQNYIFIVTNLDYTHESFQMVKLLATT